MPETTFRLEAKQLDSLIQVLRDQGYQVFGPTIPDQAIVYDEIRSAGDLPQGWTDDQEKGFYRLKKRNDKAYFGYAVGPHSWKKFLQLPHRKVWEANKTEDGFRFEETSDEVGPMVFLGVRSCELHAIAIQDRMRIRDSVMR